jgi:outer membrane protein assembly factor BamA
MCVFARAFVVSGSALAQDPTPGVLLPTDASGYAAVHWNRFAGIPVLTTGPTFGVGVGAVIAMLFRADSNKTPSAIGVGGAVSSNSSWFTGVGGRLHFADDWWRVTGGFGVFSVTYKFYGVGFDAGEANRWLHIRQRGNAGMLEVEYRFEPHFYIGPRYRYIHENSRLDPSDTIGPVAALVHSQPTYYGSLGGGVVDYDTRDVEWNPSKGTLLHGEAMYASTQLFGSNVTFDSYRGDANQYVTLTSRQVLALRVTACSVSIQAPPWELCLFGANPDLRGYIAGRYRDHRMLTGQAEWRMRVWGRFGAEVFTGVGEVAPTFEAMTSRTLLPSYGLGARYLASYTRHASISADYAWGRSGNSAFYFRFGNAF